MKLKIRYENSFQTIELDAKATDEMWVSLSLDCDEEITQEERERLIQDAWDEQYNKPEYNNWHKQNRHSGIAKMRNKEGKVEINTEEAIMANAANTFAFFKPVIDMETELENEEFCELIHNLLKPSTAEMVIAIAIDGYSASEYAELIGDNANNVSHRYRRAIKKLRKIFSETSF